MQGHLTLFLLFIFVTLVMNTVLIWLVYKGFAGFTSKMTETMTEFEQSGKTRAWIRSLESAAQHAVTASETTKQRMAELDPMLAQVQERYARSLAVADTRLEQAGEEVSNGARKMRDVVAKPAFSVMAFVAGLSSALSEPDDEGGPQ